MSDAFKPTITKTNLGEFRGNTVEKFTFSNENGITVAFTSLGATLLSMLVPDCKGKAEEVTINHDTFEELVADRGAYYGATVGRVANRIAKGIFSLGENSFSLPCNNGPNSLHGGINGFDKVVWACKEIVEPFSGLIGVEFTHTSADGEEGYPGQLSVSVKYTLSPSNELRMSYTATTDQTTPVNLTNHTYWNLSGCARDSVLSHELQMQCSRYLPLNPTQIPIGHVAAVEGTPMDFTSFKRIGKDIMGVIDASGVPGYDHCFVVDENVVEGWTDEATETEAEAEAGVGIGKVVLRRRPGARTRRVSSFEPASEGDGDEEEDAVAPRRDTTFWGPSLAAEVREPSSGRRMRVWTDQPGLQLYSMNYSRDVAPHVPHNALCLETQGFPDAVNQPQFPTVLLHPNETYQQLTIYQFSWD